MYLRYSCTAMKLLKLIAPLVILKYQMQFPGHVSTECNQTFTTANSQFSVVTLKHYS